MTIQQHIKRCNKLKDERSNYNAWWEEIAKYCVPRKSGITVKKSSGEKFDTTVYDSTAIMALQILAAGLHGYLTNPSAKWFSLRTQNKALMDSRAVKIWFKEVEDEIFNTLNSSNFDQQVHEGYIEMSAFGTTALYLEEDIQDRVRFYCVPVSEVFIAESSQGRVNTLYRKFEYTADQAYEKWGDKAGEAVKSAINEKQYDKKFWFIHVIAPRETRDPGKKTAKNMPFESIFIEESKKHEIAVGGYEEFPYFVVRFNKEAGKVWGYSPAMIALPDIKMLNRMSKTIIRGAQKIVDPPLIVPHDGFLLPLNLNPGKVNFALSNVSTDTLKPLNTHANIPVGIELENQRRETINRIFFVDLFLAMAQLKKQMTVPEVMERISEKMLILGPTLGRLMSEFLDPIIVRTLNILARQGALPLVPPELENINYVVEYISPLARAQRQSEVTSLTQALATIGQIAEFNAEALDKVNVDKTVNIISDLHGISPEIIRDDEEVAKIRQARAEAQANAQKMEELARGAAIAKDAAKAEKDAGEAVKV